MKFVFNKQFKFEEHPAIMKCYNEYNDLVDASYEMEELYNAGKYTKEQLLEASEKNRHYYYNDYAYQIYLEFYGKGLMICECKTKKKILFDEKFSSDFETFSQYERSELISLVEPNYGWKLPKEFYK